MEAKMEKKKFYNLDKAFKEEIPLDFLKDIVEKLPEVYRESYKEVNDKFFPAQAKDLLPHFRRAKIDELLINIVASYNNLDASIHKNEAKNCHHTEVQVGSIVLTANAVSRQREMVRDARFRKTLAEPNQLWLLPNMDNRQRGDTCFGMILHGPMPNDQSKVAFVCLGFPEPNGDYYVKHENLADYCNLDLYPKAPVEEIEDKANPSRRRGSLKQEG